MANRCRDLRHSPKARFPWLIQPTKRRTRRRSKMTTTLKGHPCNFASLLGKVFGVDSDELLVKWGYTPQQRLCAQCNKPLHRQQKFYCSRSCWVQSRQVPVRCTECDKLFYLRQSEVLTRTARYDNLYCSRSCMGRVAGTKYGFTAHPENIALGSRRRKYDYDAIWATHIQTGLGARKLGRLLEIPAPSVESILRKGRAERGYTK